MKKLLTTALKVIKKIEEHGYEAYIVGGYVRDHLMGLDSNDVDICTNAKPKELIKIFEGAILPAEDYGSVTIYIKNNRFEITTFRREISYNDYRRPVEIEYIDDLKEDIMRRDFTINTICMDKNKKIIDYLNARQDLANHLIKPVGDANYKFSQDVLKALGYTENNEWMAMQDLSKYCQDAIPTQLKELQDLDVLHDRVIDVASMKDVVCESTKEVFHD